MNTIDKIPVSKVQRATKIASTGAKVGVNYLKYFGDKMITDKQSAKGRLNQNNADDIYDGLKQLKGSALKVAQMLSMEKSIMPQAYVDKFSLAQFSVPPLSPPLVIKTFKKYFGKHPNEIFEFFNTTSVNAASIGQVHIAHKNGKKLAVKIQYPGVADSISSDLALVKPIALSMFNIKAKDSEVYFKEVETKLMEETDYRLELRQSVEIASACSHIPNLRFPNYYDEWSSERIITMDFMSGKHLSEIDFSTYPSQARNRIGQALWDFYMYQIHVLRKVHADPHPGNFIVSEEDDLTAIDFGCIKSIPLEFYDPYFSLIHSTKSIENEQFISCMHELEILKDEDTDKETLFFSNMFIEMLDVFTKPFQLKNFDFSNPDFFAQITALGEKYSNNKELRKMNGNRGSEHFIYMNRTFFGLFNLMFDIKADEIKINNYLSLDIPTNGIYIK